VSSDQDSGEGPPAKTDPVSFFQKLSLWERVGVGVGFLLMSWLVVLAIAVFFL